MGRQHAEVPSPGVVVFIDFTAQAKLSRFERAEVSVLRTLPFGFNPGDALGTQGKGV